MSEREAFSAMTEGSVTAICVECASFGQTTFPPPCVEHHHHRQQQQQPQQQQQRHTWLVNQISFAISSPSNSDKKIKTFNRQSYP